MKFFLTIFLVLAATASFADPVKDAMQEYSEFANVMFVFVPSKDEFLDATIPGGGIKV